MNGWDFGEALILGIVVHSFVDWFKRAVPVKLGPSVMQLCVWGAGIGSVFLVGATVWAHQNVLGGVALDNMNGWSKVAAGVIVGGIATGWDRLSVVQSRDQDPGKKVVALVSGVSATSSVSEPPANLAQHPA